MQFLFQKSDKTGNLDTKNQTFEVFLQFSRKLQGAVISNVYHCDLYNKLRLKKLVTHQRRIAKMTKKFFFEKMMKVVFF